MGIFDEENFVIFIVVLMVFLMIAIFMSLHFAVVGFLLVLLLFYVINRDSENNRNDTY